MLPPIYNKDLNNITDSGIFADTNLSEKVNAPSDLPTGLHLLIVHGYQTNRVVQVIISGQGGIASRYLLDETWSKWTVVK